MGWQFDSAELAPALTDLQDAFARVRAQLHVLRLAMSGLRDERDIRAILCQLNTIEDELHLSEGMLKKTGSGH